MSCSINVYRYMAVAPIGKNPFDISFAGFEQREHRERHNNITAKRMSGRTDDKRERPQRQGEAPKKYVSEWLAKKQEQRVRVKFTNGRQVTGILKGFDQLMNLVLDDVEETMRDPEDSEVMTTNTRHLGLVVVRGPLLLTIAPVDGMEEIENPFVQQ